jgi:hypothetical protein
MNNTMPSMPDINWADKLPLFWYYVHWFVAQNQIWVMLLVAVTLAGAMVSIITWIFRKAVDNGSGDDDDDEYEMHHY